jgi:hypothetical protein
MTAHHILDHLLRCPTEQRDRAAKEATSVSHAEDPGRYEIRVKGHLADRWVAWFDGMTLDRQADGTTVLQGEVADQSALHGLLRKISDLGLPLVSVTPTDAPTDQHARRSTP